MKRIVVLFLLLSLLLPVTISEARTRAKVRVTRTHRIAMRGPVDLFMVAWQPWPGAPVSTYGCIRTWAPPNSITWVRSYTKGDITGDNSRSMEVYAKQYDRGTYIKYVVVSVVICGNPAGGSWCVVKPRPSSPQVSKPEVYREPVRKRSYVGTSTSAGIGMTVTDFQPRPASYNVGGESSEYRSLVTASKTWYQNNERRPRSHPVKPVCPPPVPPPPTPPTPTPQPCPPGPGPGGGPNLPPGGNAVP